MWERITRWLAISTPSTPRMSPLDAAFLAQQKLIEGVVARQQELLAQQQATLDRIVTARYDRPVERIVHPVTASAMPDWAMSDQGDVQPLTAASDPIGAGIAALHVDSDRDFLEATN